MVQDIIGLLRFVSLGAFLTFGIGYQFLTQGRWRRRPEGWWLMGLVFIIVEFIAYAVAVQVWGPVFWGRTAFGLVVWCTLTAWPVSLIVLLIRAQLRTRRARLDSPFTALASNTLEHSMSDTPSPTTGPTPKGFKFEPVAWMATILSVLVAVEAANEGVHFLPTAWSPYLLGAIAILTAVLGKLARARTTALAAPRDADGTPLTPAGS